MYLVVNDKVKVSIELFMVKKCFLLRGSIPIKETCSRKKKLLLYAIGVNR